MLNRYRQRPVDRSVTYIKYQLYIMPFKLSHIGSRLISEAKPWPIMTFYIWWRYLLGSRVPAFMLRYISVGARMITLLQKDISLHIWYFFITRKAPTDQCRILKWLFKRQKNSPSCSNSIAPSLPCPSPAQSSPALSPILTSSNSLQRLKNSPRWCIVG